MTSIQGKTTIATGAANGIGRAEADLLAQSGAYVVFTDLDEVNGTSAAEAFGGHEILVRHDVSSASDWERVIDAVFNRLGCPGDIASLARYLISDESSFVTAADFLADGGYTL
ncbi:SDR family oxidoreductase [Methylovorus mays]|uniref:SDR family oxidoreductase n=1 Tax=Methylovorus mays TaxID=184077 RepID=UPI001E32E41B|nr:SDR family oxidoreductase [Methylovorus mays]MCB5206817.1 SDR family oxidoreductase [Methylovorus mays]